MEPKFYLLQFYLLFQSPEWSQQEFTDRILCHYASHSVFTNLHLLLGCTLEWCQFLSRNKRGSEGLNSGVSFFACKMQKAVALEQSAALLQTRHSSGIVKEVVRYFCSGFGVLHPLYLSKHRILCFFRGSFLAHCCLHTYGVPQGSIKGPSLLSHFMLLLGHFIPEMTLPFIAMLMALKYINQSKY